jgi:pimeloyl-ACP methyl ester carboxylesterase
MNDQITAQEWFSAGTRVTYDPVVKKIGDGVKNTDAAGGIHVWKRVERNPDQNNRESWTTFLPGFPDGSFGWAKVDQQLSRNGMLPKIYVEYVGQGDSDKPSGYSYGTMERADLVEALWEAEGIQSTFVVTFDYSSLVVLELLSRQEERLNQGIDSGIKIKGVLMANGGYFADAHSHPLMTTPALRSPIGGIVTWVGQRSPFVSRQLLKSMFSKEYRLTSDEFNEIYDAISRRNGFSFVSRAAGFVAEHRARYGERWDLRRLYLALRESVSFHIVGSEGDIFEPNQVVKARERLGDQGLDIRMLPGGHMITSEQPDQFARIIQEVGPSSAVV